MTGRAEVSRLKQQLDATFKRVKSAGQEPELQSDFARYLCVLVSGYIERAIVALVLEHAREKGAPTLQHFVERRTKKFVNPNANRIQELLGDFDSSWPEKLWEFLDDEKKSAINSIVSQRNAIVHGGSSGITYYSISEYYQQAQRVIDRVAELCVPE